MTNTCLSIQGHLIVNKSFTIDGGEIIMNPGAEVTVVGGSTTTFTIRNVNQNGGVHGCTAMWRGIGIRMDRTTISVENSIVQDGQFALNSNTRLGGINAQSSIFLNNYTAIRLWRNTASLPPQWNSTNLGLWGNTFTTNNQYLPAYTGQIPDPAVDVMTGTGVWVESATAATVGLPGQAPNVFDNVKVGIFGVGSTVLARNNIFRNIQSPDPNLTYNSLIHMGIRVEIGGVGSYTPNLTAIGNTFENCTLGIRALNSPLRAENNRILRCKYGIVVHDPVQRSIRINNGNEFEAGIGILVSGQGPAQEIIIEDNDMLITPDVASSNGGIAGILVSGWASLMSANNQFLISNNRITGAPNGPWPSSFWGIAVSRTNGARIENNPGIRISGAGTDIVVAGSQNTVVRKNTIIKEPSAFFTAGMLVSDSPNTLVQCNELEATTSLWFTGMSDCVADPAGNPLCTRIRGNILEYVATPSYAAQGLYFYNAVSSPQKWQANEWYSINGPPTNDYGARYFGNASFAQFSRFTNHSPSLPWHPLAFVNDSQTNPNVWFIPEISSTYFNDCTLMLTGDGDPDDAINIYEIYAGGGPENAGYGKGAQWIAERHLYRNLAAAPSLLSHASLNQFYTTAQNGPIGSFHLVEQGLEALNQMPAPTKAALDSLWELADEYADLLEYLMQLPDPGDSQALALLQQEQAETADALEAVAGHIQDMHNQLAAVRDTQILHLQTLNAGVVPVNAPGIHLKTAYAIYLAHAGDHSDLSSGERAELEPIAALCPAEGGDAVYMARAMLGLHGGEGCSTLPQNLQVVLPEAHLAVQAPEPASVYPNPGQGAFFFNIPLTESGQVEVRIYSLTGRQVHRSVLPAGGVQPLLLTSLPAGIFLYEVWDEGKRLMNGKLSKVN